MAIINYPAYLQPSAADEIVGFNIQTAADQPARGVSWGQAFVPGKVPATASLVAKIGTQTVPAQMDWKTKHPDGSVWFAVITVLAPPTTSASVVKGMLSLGGTVAPPLDMAARLADYDVAITLSGGVSAAINVGPRLIEALADAPDYWLRGGNAVQARLDVPIESSLHIVVDVTAYADGSFQTDAQFRNDYSMQATGGTLNYSAAISQNGAAVFNATVDHFQYEVWRRVFHTGGAPTSDTHNVQRDIAYYIKTGALQNYDLTTGIDDTSIAAFTSTNITPLSNPGYSKHMPGTGARDDIGLVPAWHARWIKCQGWKAAQTALAMGNGAGSIPWHHFDPTTNDYVSLDTYPNLWIDTSNRGETDLTQPQQDTSWELDNAHAPGAAFVPYLFTGERYFLDEVDAQASRQILAMWDDPRQQGKGIVMVGTNAFEVRAQCWTLRNLIEAAWSNPDDRAAKQYWLKLLDNNYSFILNTVIPQWNARVKEVAGYFYGGDEAESISSWQQDFTVSVLAIAVSLQVNPNALTVMQWAENFNIGRFTHEAQGFGLGAAFAYKLKIETAGSFYDTWTELGAVNKQEVPTDGGYWVPLGLDTLATIYNTTGNAQALTSYNAVKALDIPGTGPADYQTLYPQYHIVPKTTGPTGPTMTKTQFTITIAPAGGGVPSTSAIVTQVAGLVAPVAIGARLANLVVAPTTWLGTAALSGTDAATMRIGGTAPNFTIEAAQSLPAGAYTATVTVTP